MLQKIGSYLFIFGVLAIVLDFIHMVPILLMWIYNWGESTAWIIKITLVVTGAALWIGGKILGNPSSE